jgi:hypothetical protein
MKLTVKQRKTLVKALENAFNLDEFDRMVRAATGAERERFAGGRRTSDAMIEEVVVVAERRGRELTEIVREAVADRPGRPDLKRIADEVEIMLRDSARDEVAGTLMDIARRNAIDEAVLGAYRRFATGNTDDLEAPADRIAFGIKRLADSTPAEKQHPPLLLFATYLANRSDEEVPASARKELDAWLNEALPLFELKRSAKNALRTRARQIVAELADARLYLLVTVRPLGGDILTVRAWSQLTGADGEPKGDAEPVGDHQACTPDTLARVVTELLIEAEEARNATGSVTVEIFLPVELLNFPFDQHLFTPPAQPASRFGTRFPLVVRSLNRAYDSELKRVRKDWLVQWGWYRPNRLKVRTCDRDRFTGDLYGLDVRDTHQASHVVLNFVPEPNDYTMGGAIGVIITTGTPVALWPRVDAEGYPAVVADLAIPAAADWRDAVKRLRIDAARSEAPQAHPGSHLALLWDEPTRVPPDAQHKFEMTGARP